MTQRSSEEGPKAAPRRSPIFAAAMASAIVVAGCESREVGSVPQIPDRGETQKNAEFPALKGGAKPSKGQLRGAGKDG